MPTSVTDSEDELQAGDEIIVAHRPSGTRELPARSTRATISYAKPTKKQKAKSARSNRKSVKLLKSDTNDKPISAPNSARVTLRRDILDRTRPRRDAFILANQDLFKPLLPANNYVTKHLSQGAKSRSIIELEAIEAPSGIKAVMKPYQLEGLSFLVQMHKNGISPILGDEMGLGKTLQTLSLFQYIAENESRHGERQPHLVICPLSVLSSWIAETRKWTNLNVVRFHGPPAEREKLKKQLLPGASKASAMDRSSADIVVTTYHTFKSDSGWFKRAFAWKYCVLDEGHAIKSKSSKVVYQFQFMES
jgi:SWI/SNF-related matrix-associated actin-dependent regulator of chromatin subfamily A member 5